MKRLSVRLLRSAEADIDAVADWYGSEAGADVAERFRKSIDDAVMAIADNAKLGSLIGSSRRDLAQMRKRAIRGFPRYRVFYIARPEIVEIVRVLHSSQDWWLQFEVE